MFLVVDAERACIDADVHSYGVIEGSVCALKMV